MVVDSPGTVTRPSMRAVVLAPNGGESGRTLEMLREGGFEAQAVLTGADLLDCLRSGAAAVILADDALGADDGAALAAWVESQPAWSDIPFLVLTDHRFSGRTLKGGPPPPLGRIVRGGNVTFLQRPVRAAVLATSVRTALRRRARQYSARAMLEERAATASPAPPSDLPPSDLPPSDLQHRLIELEAANARLRQEAGERARDDARLRQAEKLAAVSHLAGGIAHDVNNLLTALMGSLELIQTRTKEPRTRQLAKHGLAAVERGARLMRQLLTFSRIQRLELTAVPLHALLTGMRDLLEGTLTKAVEVRIELEPSIPDAVADAAELELALLNLALNAGDAMPDGGMLLITGATRDEAIEGVDRRLVVISVSDTGNGMTQAVQARAFEPFFTTKEVGRGSGMGLSQVFGLAEQSGGRVVLHSSVGKGTTVDLMLPQAHAHPELLSRAEKT